MDSSLLSGILYPVVVAIAALCLPRFGIWMTRPWAEDLGLLCERYQSACELSGALRKLGREFDNDAFDTNAKTIENAARRRLEFRTVQVARRTKHLLPWELFAVPFFSPLALLVLQSVVDPSRSTVDGTWWPPLIACAAALVYLFAFWARDTIVTRSNARSSAGKTLHK